jgi:hypothetical protein
MEYVEQEVNIKVALMNKDRLIDSACKSYNDWNETWNSDEAATKNSDSLFLQRICVNYLRHEKTTYEDHLYEIHGRVGVLEAYFSIKDKVLDAIAKAYPWLVEECNRQKS